MNWLLLRGLARDLRHWDDFPRIFEKQTGSQTFCVDLPGAGQNYKTKSPTTVRDITLFLRPKWEQFRRIHDGPWGVLGVSLGGMVTLDWISQFKDFQAAVVINSSSRDVSKPWERLQTQALPHLGASIWNRNPVQRELHILKMTTNLVQPLMEKAKQRALLEKEYPVINLNNAARQMMAAATFQSPEKVLSSLLFLGSKGDHMVDPRCTEKLALKYKADLHWHPDAGHDLPLDDPQWISGIVSQWHR